MDGSKSALPDSPAARHASLRWSFNDLNTLTHDEEVDRAPQRHVMPGANPGHLQRHWSLDSESVETPRRTPSSFTETFTRALYEHMRGN